MPRRAAVPITDWTAAHRSGPQAERKPPVTLRCTTIGRRSRSLPLLSGGASGCSRKVNRPSRTARLQAQLAAYKLLIVDELGYVPLSPSGAELLFEVFSRRYERGSI